MTMSMIIYKTILFHLCMIFFFQMTYNLMVGINNLIVELFIFLLEMRVGNLIK